jgi:hypothetical protein
MKTYIILIINSVKGTKISNSVAQVMNSICIHFLLLLLLYFYCTLCTGKYTEKIMRLLISA